MGSSPPQAPLSSSSPSSPSSLLQQKASPPRNSQTLTLPPLATTMPHRTSNAPLQTSPSNSAPAPIPPQQQQYYSDYEPQAPPYSPITPPTATTPPPMPENDVQGAPTPSGAPPKTVTHIPPPTIPPNFASMGGRALLTHTTHPPVVATAQAPLLEPIDFDDNPDAIALDATIAILLHQKKKAEADIRHLKDVKAAAMQRPLEFYNDLKAGRISMGSARGTATPEQDDEEDDNVNEEANMAQDTKKDGANSMDGLERPGLGAKGHEKQDGKAKGQAKGKGKAEAVASSSSPASSNRNGAVAASAPPLWRKLPMRQDIVRMPPINWSQYAVEGESLDRLHNQQMKYPTRGTPAVIAANGTYSFTGGANPDDGKVVQGISAPFDPLRDRVDETTAISTAAPRKGT